MYCDLQPSDLKAIGSLQKTRANSCGPLTASLQWNLIMNSVGFSLRKEWVGSVRVGVVAAEAKSESPLRKGQGLHAQQQGREGQQKVYKHLSGMAQQLRAQRGEQDPCPKQRGTSVYLQRCHLGFPPGQKRSAIWIGNCLEVSPHNRLRFPDHIMCEMTVLHLVQMCSYGMLDLVQIL